MSQLPRSLARGPSRRGAAREGEPEAEAKEKLAKKAEREALRALGRAPAGAALLAASWALAPPASRLRGEGLGRRAFPASSGQQKMQQQAYSLWRGAAQGGGRAGAAGALERGVALAAKPLDGLILRKHMKLLCLQPS